MSGFDPRKLASDLFDGPLRDVRGQRKDADRVIKPHILALGFSDEDAEMLLYLVEQATFAGAVLGAVYGLTAIRDIFNVEEITQRIDAVILEVGAVALEHSEPDVMPRTSTSTIQVRPQNPREN